MRAYGGLWGGGRTSYLISQPDPRPLPARNEATVMQDETFRPSGRGSTVIAQGAGKAFSGWNIGRREAGPLGERTCPPR
ncbi:UNVERIFIED_CONTAM: hypothetical protein K2H54_048497 [Gekko kuhli]